MRYSADLNIIIKALEKASTYILRDFAELENLQNNPISANKFSNSCYLRVQKILSEDLSKMRGGYNVTFADGSQVINNKGAEYSYLIFPIDGLENLTRSCADFTVAVALQHIKKDGTKQAISVAINKVVGKELFYCEKGFGAYLNNRRIRVSKRLKDSILVSCRDLKLLTDLGLKNFDLRYSGSRTLDIAYLASAKVEKVVIEKSALLEPFLLLVREAGGRVEEKNGVLVVNSF